MSKKRKSQDVSARRRRMQEKGVPWSYVIPVIIILIAVGGLIYYSSSLKPPSNGGGPYGPYPFPCLGGETTVMHIHPYLRIVINGQNVTIPAGVGINNPVTRTVAVTGTQSENYVGSGSCFEPMHTHDASGIIHIEAPNANTNYTLSDFFQIWNSSKGSVSLNGNFYPVVFNSTDILGFKADATHRVVLLVDGQNSTLYGALNLNQLAYCSASSSTPPCAPSAQGDPTYPGGYLYGTGHTIVIEYETIS